MPGTIPGRPRRMMPRTNRRTSAAEKVLEALRAAATPMTACELAVATGLSAETVDTLVRTLCRQGRSTHGDPKRRTINGDRSFQYVIVLTPVETVLRALLDRDRPIPAGEIAVAAHPVTRHAIDETLRRLTDHGWVTIAPDSSYHLTETGREIAQARWPHQATDPTPASNANGSTTEPDLTEATRSATPTVLTMDRPTGTKRDRARRPPHIHLSDPHRRHDRR